MKIRVDLGMRIGAIYRETGQPGRELEVLEKVMVLMPAGQAGSEIFWKAATQLSAGYRKADQLGKARKVHEEIMKKYPQADIRRRAEKELKKLK